MISDTMTDDDIRRKGTKRRQRRQRQARRRRRASARWRRPRDGARSIASARRRLPREFGGRGGHEPVRYGDWEMKGLASDF